MQKMMHEWKGAKMVQVANRDVKMEGWKNNTGLNRCKK